MSNNVKFLFSERGVFWGGPVDGLPAYVYGGLLPSRIGHPDWPGGYYQWTGSRYRWVQG